jgi:hypothetical protein
MKVDAECDGHHTGLKICKNINNFKYIFINKLLKNNIYIL